MSGPYDKLFVIWADPDGRRSVVGELWRVPEGFAFGYDVDRLDEARDAGFQLLPEFPALRGTADPYVSATLFHTFKNRLPAPERSDSRQTLTSWGVVSDDPMEILAKSGGVLLTDSIELAEHRAEDDDLSRPLSFRLSGQRHAASRADLQPGTELRLRRDPENPRDPSATILLTLGEVQVGWVPKQYSRLIARHLDDGEDLTAHVERQLLLPEARGRAVVKIERRPAEHPVLRVAEPPAGGRAGPR